MASGTLELSHFQLGAPSSQFTYRSASGQPTLIACRFDQPDGGKSFRPYDTARHAWKAPQTRPIYNLDKIAIADHETPIIIVEGEMRGCAARAGLSGTLGGAYVSLQGLTGCASTIFGTPTRPMRCRKVCQFRWWASCSATPSCKPQCVTRIWQMNPSTLPPNKTPTA